MINENTYKLIKNIKNKINNVVKFVSDGRFWLSVLSLPIQLFFIGACIATKKYDLLMISFFIYPVFLFFLVMITTVFLKFQNTIFNKKWFQKLVFNKEEIEFIEKNINIGFNFEEIKKENFSIKFIEKIIENEPSKQNLNIIISNFELKESDNEKMIQLIKKVYKSKEFLEVVYNKNVSLNKELKDYLQKNKDVKIKILNDKSYILNKLDIQDIFNYKEVISIIGEKNIVLQFLNYIPIKDMVRIMFEKDNTLTSEINKKYYLENLYPLWSFFQSNHVRLIISIKKEIINLVLKSENIKNIEGFEFDFIKLAEELEINKEELLVIKQMIKKEEIIKNESLKIIHI